MNELYNEKKELIESAIKTQSICRKAIIYNTVIFLYNTFVIFFILFAIERPEKFTSDWYIQFSCLILVGLLSIHGFKKLCTSIYSYLKITLIKDIVQETIDNINNTKQ